MDVNTNPDNEFAALRRYLWLADEDVTIAEKTAVNSIRERRLEQVMNNLQNALAEAYWLHEKRQTDD